MLGFFIVFYSFSGYVARSRGKIMEISTFDGFKPQVSPSAAAARKVAEKMWSGLRDQHIGCRPKETLWLCFLRDLLIIETH